MAPSLPPPRSSGAHLSKPRRFFRSGPPTAQSKAVSPHFSQAAHALGRERAYLVAFEHWWIGLWAGEDEYQSLQPHFSAAAEKTAVSLEAEHALAAWKLCPSDFEEEAMTNERLAAQVNAFIWAFNLPGFVELANELLTKDGKLSAFCIEERIFRIAIAGRHTPASIVWHALGYERASLLPGRFGNMLLRAGDVAAAEEKVRSAYAGTSRQDLLDTAKRYCGGSVCEGTLSEAIDFLPEGLAQARQRTLGFLALARPQL